MVTSFLHSILLYETVFLIFIYFGILVKLNRLEVESDSKSKNLILNHGGIKGNFLTSFSLCGGRG